MFKKIVEDSTDLMCTLNGDGKIIWINNTSKEFMGFHQLIYVDIRSNIITRDGRRAENALANDITDRVKHMETIEKQNERLKEIPWLQSHVVRALLTRMMALIKENAFFETNYILIRIWRFKIF